MKHANRLFMMFLVLGVLVGCGKPLVSFETLEDPNLTLGFQVEGANAALLKTALRQLDFLKVVQDAPADRILTGEAGPNGCSLTFAHLDGRSIIQVKAQSVEESVEKLQPALMTSYVLKTFARARAENQPFKLEVKADRGPDEPYRATEFIQFQVKSEKPCYLTLLELAPNGKINILYPNAYSPQQQIEGGKWYVIPDPDSGIRIQIDPYPGQGTVWAVGHEKHPLDLAGMTGYRVEEAEGYLTLSHAESAQFLHKLFPVIFPSRAVVVGDPWATAYTVYRVE